MAAAAPSPAAPAPPAREDVRCGLRAMLSSQPGFAALDAATRRDLAGGLVRIGSAALAHEEAAGPPAAPRPRPAIASAQNAGAAFSGAATDRLARTTRDVLDAVSFPRFVSELITGVFKAMNDSNQQQLTAFVDLVRNVAQTTEGFADANVGLAGARRWLAERFPTSYAIEGGGEGEGIEEDLSDLEPDERRRRQEELQAERDAATALVLRPGATAPTEAALRAALEVEEGVPLPAGEPEALVPLARQVLARSRQQLLATMVQMGLQRIVIESGRLNAAMRFHIDTSSVANDDRGSQFDMRNSVGASAGGSFGPWGASANVQSTIGYVSTNRTQTSEEVNTELELDSGVELIFRTDYVPLDRLAGGAARDRIRVNALNPEAEAKRAAADRSARDAARAGERTARSAQIDAALKTPPQPAPAGGAGAALPGAGPKTG